MLIVKGGEKIPEPEVIATPSFGLNYILGGGFWTGRYHVLWGNPQAGKTTLALYILAEAQRNGYVPVIIDAEGSITDEWLEQCGIDTDNRILIRSTILEDIMGYALPLLREKESHYVFLIDSLNTVVMQSFYNNDQSTGAIGIYARSQTAMLQKFADEMIQNVNHMMIMVAQQTIESKGQHMVRAGKFGNAAKHWATNVIRLSASDAKGKDNMEQDDDERILNRKVTWKIEKSKQAPIQGVIGDYWFSPQTANIDRAKEAVHLAVRNGIIQKKGAWYVWGDEKYQGVQNLVDALTEDDLKNIVYQLEEVEMEFDRQEVNE